MNFAIVLLVRVLGRIGLQHGRLSLLLRADLRVRAVHARTLPKLPTSILFRVAVLVFVAVVARVRPVDALRALGGNQPSLRGDAVSLIPVGFRSVRVVALIPGEAGCVDMGSVPFVCVLEVPRVEVGDGASPLDGLRVLVGALEDDVLRPCSLVLVHGYSFSILFLAGHLLLSFVDFGLLWPAQIQRAAWIRVLFDLMGFIDLLQILMGVALLDNLASVAARWPVRLLLHHLEVLLRLRLLLVVALRLLVGLPDLATEGARIGGVDAGVVLSSYDFNS